MLSYHFFFLILSPVWDILGYATINELIKLNQVAIQQMKVLEESENRKYLK